MQKNRRLRFFAISGLLVSLFPAIGGSQQAPQAESLHIGPGDTLQVQVFDAPELGETARVTDAGELPLVLGGKVKVVNLTVDEAARAIEKVLQDGQYVLQPKVLVSDSDYLSRRVMLTGEFKAPGLYPLPTPRPLLDVLTLGGGLGDDASRNIVIQRGGTGERINYYVSNTASVALDTTIEVYPGDKIFASKAAIVYMLGDVGKPGGYIMSNNYGNISVLELLARAGGMPASAVPSHAKLMRKSANGYVRMPLPLSAMQKGNRADMVLQPDDIVYVPFSYLRAMAESSEGIIASVGTAALYKY